MQDFLLIHLILVDFILPLLKSYKVILYPGLSLTHRGVPMGTAAMFFKSLSYHQCFPQALPKSVSYLIFPPNSSLQRSKGIEVLSRLTRARLAIFLQCKDLNITKNRCSNQQGVLSSF